MSDKILTYISLFSGAGIGCYGFLKAGFKCVATTEIIERRLNVQRVNRKCDYESGYIGGNMTDSAVRGRVFGEIDRWRKERRISEIDAVIATPPCQGMSVANHKKKDELGRNSLVIESLKLIREIRPRFFIIENVRSFLKSVCADVDGIERPIGDAIENSLSGLYNISAQVLNFKEYGCPSSRTRTLVVGSRKDLREITPLDILPGKSPERTLREVIGHLPPLTEIGEICHDDIYHNFKPYPAHMREWIAHVPEGKSAFDNADENLIPWTEKNGTRIRNVNKNGDKYTRQFWDVPAPCVHTRNDIMASQNTVHPSDDRVFSIREIMLMMSVPNSFQWTDIPESRLNALPLPEKTKFLKKEEMNIRQTLGEAVPTAIFKQIAERIIALSNFPSEKEIALEITTKGLSDAGNLKRHIKSGDWGNLPALFKTIELANPNREASAAYYTRQDICYAIIKNLPEFSNRSEIRIIEPSVGAGNFLPLLARKYAGVGRVVIDVVDIDQGSLDILKATVKEFGLPPNIGINFIRGNFLTGDFATRCGLGMKYDLAIGNPPFGKIKDKTLLAKCRKEAANARTSNIFAFFIEKAMRLSRFTALITPKSLIAAPEFDDTRKAVSSNAIKTIMDFGETAFKGVKIETICLMVDTTAYPNKTCVESWITWSVRRCAQNYITDAAFPNWLIYRDSRFDETAGKMQLDVFRSWRDRVITKKITKDSGRIRILKSRNIGNNKIIDIPGYDCWINSLEGLDAARFLDRTDCVLVPNLTYNPRACFMPKGCIADGSVAILIPKTGEKVAKRHLAYYATDEFSEFYSIARNFGSRSLNIDRNSVFYFGKLEEAR